MKPTKKTQNKDLIQEKYLDKCIKEIEAIKKDPSKVRGFAFVSIADVGKKNISQRMSFLHGHPQLIADEILSHRGIAQALMMMMFTGGPKND